MKVAKLAIIAGAALVLALASLANTAYAWHPKGAIVKRVQNISTSSALRDADTAASAVSAKPGDTLKYVIEVRNDGKPDSKGWNDMAKTVMTDTLPAGVELASNPTQRQITENLGVLTPGQKVTKEYLVKVTATTDATITNTACFTGDSKANDSPQKGCNPAVINVNVPEVPPVPEMPKPPVTPEAPTPETPLELPQTGFGENILLSTLAIGIVSYATYRYVQSKRELADAHLTR